MNGLPPGDRPLLLTLGLDATSFDRLDSLRNRYFPADRNIVPAHISLFHDLPGAELEAIHETLARQATQVGPFPVQFPSLFRLGRGVAARVESNQLTAVHKALATVFAGWLTPQDRQPYRPHVTLMNKAEPAAVARAWAELGAGWSSWEGTGEALLLWRYLGGPWELVERYPFPRTQAG